MNRPSPKLDAMLEAMREGALTSAEWHHFARSRHSLINRVEQLRQRGYVIATTRESRAARYRLVSEPGEVRS